MPERTFCWPSTTTRSPGFSPLALAHLDLPRRHPVVTPHHHYFVPALKLGHRWLRDKQSAFVLSGHSAHHRILAGTQDVARIRKQSRHLDGAGAGIHLAIGKREPAVLRMRGPVGQDQLQLQMMKCVGAGKTKVLLLANSKDRFDWVQCGYRSHRGA